MGPPLAGKHEGELSPIFTRARRALPLTNARHTLVRLFFFFFYFSFVDHSPSLPSTCSPGCPFITRRLRLFALPLITRHPRHVNFVVSPLVMHCPIVTCHPWSRHPSSPLSRRFPFSSPPAFLVTRRLPLPPLTLGVWDTPPSPPGPGA